MFYASCFMPHDNRKAKTYSKFTKNTKKSKPTFIENEQFTKAGHKRRLKEKDKYRTTRN